MRADRVSRRLRASGGRYRLRAGSLDGGRRPRPSARTSPASSISTSWRCPGRRPIARRRRSARPERAPDQQCGGRPFAFVVHGLWPQYEQGFPSYCQVPAPRLDRAIVGGALDLMPSPRLVFHEWDRHGTCSGLSPHAYFETVRKARAAVKIPADYLELGQADHGDAGRCRRGLREGQSGSARATTWRSPATASG